MQRRRKYGVKEYAEKVPVRLYLFDILYLEGRLMLKRPYPERRKILEKNVRQSGKIKLAKQIVTSNIKEMQNFFEKSIKKNLEGVIVKSVENKSIYQPGNRGWLWVKWKKEYAEGMRETFDLVVIGSYYGKGQRKGKFGALLCAAYNKKKDTFESFTKVGSGYKDEDLEEINRKLEKIEVKKPLGNVSFNNDMKPDKFYKPQIVIEVLGANITTSPKHTAGKDSGRKGYALRFPRFLNIREDKSALDATTLKEIEKLK
ncbi:ATP-dependent DNA ligase [Candidatus Woesearchaeota archaeon]|nr:ATP-dependent DNA ligase [Candidatus Woesearchaeota archaeon]